MSSPSEVAIPPSAEELRKQLLERCEEFSRLTGKSLSRIGVMSVNDGRAVTTLKEGGNITLDRFDTINAFLTKNWPAESSHA